MPANRYGQLEPKSDILVLPPGTCLFDPPVAEDPLEAQQLKRHPTKKQLILRPQPSDSPRDPLNWHRLRKELLFFTLTWISCLTGVIGPILVPAFGQVSVDLGKPIPKVAQLNGILVLFEGIGGLLVIMLSTMFGRRINYVVFSLLQFVGCIWGAASKSYGSLYGARIVQGLGMAASAVLAGSTITDTFFTYEHGVRIAIWQAAYLASINLAPIISGVIATNYGWHATFWVLAAFEGVGLVLVILFLPETHYRRFASVVDRTSDSGVTKPERSHQEHFQDVKHSSPESFAAELPHPTLESAPMSIRSQLAIPLRMINTSSAIVTLIRPFMMILTPNVFYAFLAYTISFNWFVATGATYSQIYAGIYYTKDVKTVGYIAGWPPLIGTLAAALASGPITDYGARWLSLRNHGIFEPEYRLILLIPATICTAIGGFGWGWTLGPEWPIIVGEVFAAFTFAGAVLGCCGSIAYANACFPRRDGDAFGVIMLLRSAFIFGSTYYYNNFLAVYGAKTFFGVFSGVAIGIYILAVPVFFMGKVWRSRVANSRMLGWLVL